MPCQSVTVSRVGLLVVVNALLHVTVLAVTGKYYEVSVNPPAWSTDKVATAGLWVPDNVSTITAVYGAMVGKTTSPGDCKTLTRTQDFVAKMGFALYTGMNVVNGKGNPSGDPYDGSGIMLLESLDKFAALSGHPELARAPFIISGYSGGAYNAEHWAYFRPDRILAAIPERGTYMQDDRVVIWYPRKFWAAAGRVPSLLIPGGSDPLVVYPLVLRHVMAMRGLGGLKAMALQPGGVHVPVSRGAMMPLEEAWIEAIAAVRLAGYNPRVGYKSMAQFRESGGWLGNNVSRQVASFGAYTGNKASASWLPSESFANQWAGWVQGCSDADLAPYTVAAYKPAFSPGAVAEVPTPVAPMVSARGRPRLNGKLLQSDKGAPLRGPTISPFVTPTQSWWSDLGPIGHFNAVRYAAYIGPWASTGAHSMTIEKQLSLLDVAVNNAAKAGVYIMISNYSTCCGQYDNATSESFWQSVAPRYKDRSHVFYELQNDPVAWSPPYDSAAVEFQARRFAQIRALAPATHIVCWSFPITLFGIAEDVAKAPQISYENATVGLQLHRYTEAYLVPLRMTMPLLCTEIDGDSSWRAIARIKSCERFKLSWFWAGTDVKDGTFDSSGVFWPQETSAGTISSVPAPSRPGSAVERRIVTTPRIGGTVGRHGGGIDLRGRRTTSLIVKRK